MKNALQMAFEITPEDVQNVCRMYNRPVDEIKATRLLSRLDLDKVAAEALEGGTEMDDQTAAAYEEIARQLKEQNVIQNRTRRDAGAKMKKMLTSAELKLRETPGFTATASARGVRITAKECGATPRSRVVSHSIWNQLAGMCDGSFDGSVVLELGVGVFRGNI